MIALFVLAGGALLSNGTFEAWEGGRPVGWSSFAGARSGEGPACTVAPLAGGGLVLEGDASTGEWPFLTQRFPLSAGATYYLAVEARIENERRDRHQFGSQFVGVRFLDAAGNELQRSTAEVRTADFRREEFPVRAPAGAAAGEVCVFLAHTGRMEVRRVSLDAYEPDLPGDSLEVLARHMGRYYSYFELKDVDWEATVARHGPRLSALRDPDAFAAGLAEMLAALRDLHVSVHPPRGAPLYPFAPPYEPNYDFGVLRSRLVEGRQIGKTAVVGRTREGLGYVAIFDFLAAPEVYDELAVAVRGLFDAPGILLDVRANRGGDEAQARKIAGLFTAEERPYARTRIRSGPRPEDQVETPPRVLPPAGGEAYPGALVCLTGPGCASSGECFAQMIEALPGTRLVGLPTRGMSGNPRPVQLPNGVVVHYSRWIGMELDGTPLEGRGVRPHVRVAHEGPGDPTLEAGLAELARLAAGHGPAPAAPGPPAKGD